MAAQWRLVGEYFENCNCEVLCPCIIGPRNERGGALARPTEGHCDVPFVFHIEQGALGSVRLDGLGAALAVHTPGAMGAGNWSEGLDLDERADPAQRGALETIFRGDAGGPPARLALLVTTRWPTRFVPIQFEKSGRRRRAVIPDLLDIEIEGVQGADRLGEVWLENVAHPVSRRLAVARATRSAYRDHGVTWNNTGRNAHYAPFDWAGG